MPIQYPISKYRKVMKEAQPADTNEIRVRVSSPHFSYCAYAGKILLGNEHDFVHLNATGAAVANSIKVIEYLKKSIEGLHVVYRITNKEFVDEYEPLVEGLVKVCATRVVSTLEADLTVTKGADIAGQPGYMAPLPADQVDQQAFTDRMEAYAVKKENRKNRETNEGADEERPDRRRGGRRRGRGRRGGREGGRGRGRSEESRERSEDRRDDRRDNRERRGGRGRGRRDYRDDSRDNRRDDRDNRRDDRDNRRDGGRGRRRDDRDNRRDDRDNRRDGGRRDYRDDSRDNRRDDRDRRDERDRRDGGRDGGRRRGGRGGRRGNGRRRNEDNRY